MAAGPLALRFPIRSRAHTHIHTHACAHTWQMGRRTWVGGKITAQWDKGSPYRIRLEDGSDTWAPMDEDKVIRAAN